MKKGIIIMLITAISGLIFSFSVSVSALAGQWMANGTGYWYLHSDGTYPVYSWEWLDSDGDGIYQCYAFDENGYLYINTVTPDGYYVGPDGAWNMDGMPVSRFFYHNAYIPPTAIALPQNAAVHRDEYQYASDGTQLVTQKYSGPKSSSNTSSSKKTSSSSKSSSSKKTSTTSSSKTSTKTSTNVPSGEIVTSKIVTGSSSGSSSESSDSATSKSSSSSGPDVDNTSYDTDGPGRNIPSSYSSQTVRPTTDESTIDVSGPKRSGVIERDGGDDEDDDEEDED